MAKEIERKYLVKDESYKKMAQCSYLIRQGYLSRSVERTVRVRLRDSEGFLTVKGRNEGCQRLEFEYQIPAADASEMLLLCEAPLLEKRRWIVEFRGKVWEVDEFLGRKEGLTVAEIELQTPDEIFDIPPFISEEVTGDPRYYNSMM